MGYLLCCTVMDLSLCIAFCIVLCCTIALLPGTRSHLSLTRPSLNLSFLDSVTQQCIVLYCTVPDCVVLYCTVQYCTVQCSTVPWTRPSVNLSLIDSVDTDAIPVLGLG